MSVRTCEECETNEAASSCTCSGAVSTASEIDEVTALGSADVSEITAASSIRDQDTAKIDISEECTVALSLPDGEQTVRLAAPAVHRLLAGSLPRQRSAADDRIAVSATIQATALGEPTVSLPTLPSAPQPRGALDLALPRLPQPASAEELAAERLGRVDDDDNDEYEPHVRSLILFFLLALAIATGAGYALATSLSGDIQAFFDSIVQAK